MKKVLNYLYIVLFLGLLLVPLIKTNRKPYSVSEIDNRALAEAPEFGQENFPAAFETYLNDRIGFRNEMINTYNVINDILADELTHPLYIYGKDGQVFLNMTPNVTYKEYHEKFAQFVKSMQDYCESHGVGFYFAFEPEKISVLRDYLPDGVNYEDAWVDQLMAKMDELGVNYIDNRDVLVEKSKTEKVFDVQYDAGHWNDLGAFYGTNNIFKRIHEDDPIVTEMSEDEFEITTEEAEYLFIRSNRKDILASTASSLSWETSVLELISDTSSRMSFNSIRADSTRSARDSASGTYFPAFSSNFLVSFREDVSRRPSTSEKNSLIASELASMLCSSSSASISPDFKLASSKRFHLDWM